MMRASFVASVVVLVLGGACSSPAAEAPARGRPNVLFIAVDDMNDWIAPLGGYPGIQTPHLDRLARRSVTFANAHCAAPACHPSRVAVMTGVHPSRSGIYTNLFKAHGPRWRRESPMLADAVVLSRHFRDHGWWAGGSGKIFHTLQWTPNDSQNDPDAWDAYFRDPLDPLPPWPRPALVPDDRAGLTPGRPLGDRQLFGASPLDVADAETSDAKLVDWAVAELSRRRDSPFFLACGIFRPHIPWEVPRPWFDRYPLAGIRLPEHRADDLNDTFDHGRRSWHKWVVDNGLWARFVQGYLASVSFADAQIGRLLDALDASGHRDDTIVVLWSDHGFHLGEKENWEKFTLWERATRVPLFISAPGVSHGGTRCDRPASLVDLYPTLCELAGLPVPGQCDGVSLVPWLKDPGAPRDRPALTSYAFGRNPASHAVRDDRHRYIRYHDGFEELYDLRDDPHEYRNLAAEASLVEVKRRLASALPKDPAPVRRVPDGEARKE